eukprot:1412346-Ditylum_brightwellii.AAC.1
MQTATFQPIITQIIHTSLSWQFNQQEIIVLIACDNKTIGQQHQHKIRWQQFFNGKIAGLWSNIQAVSRPHHPALTSRPHLLTYT